MTRLPCIMLFLASAALACEKTPMPVVGPSPEKILTDRLLGNYEREYIDKQGETLVKVISTVEWMGNGRAIWINRIGSKIQLQMEQLWWVSDCDPGRSMLEIHAFIVNCTNQDWIGDTPTYLVIVSEDKIEFLSSKVITYFRKKT